MLHGFSKTYICSFSGYLPMKTRYANRELNVEVEMIYSNSYFYVC